MTTTGIEARLHEAMGRPRSDHQQSPDPAIWARIQERADADRQRADHENQTATRRHLAYVAALTLVAVGGLRQLGAMIRRAPLDLADPATPLLDVGAPISRWWSAVMIVAALPIIVFVHRKVGDKIVTFGVVVAITGTGVASVHMIDSASTGTRLASNSPTIENYEPVAMEQSWLPWEPGYGGVTLYYRSTALDYSQGNLVAGTPGSLVQMIDQGFVPLSWERLCREQHPNRGSAVDFYCVSTPDLDNREGLLPVEGLTSDRGNGLGAVAALAIAVIGLSLALATAADHRGSKRLDPKRRASTLLLFVTGTALVVAAATSIILLRAGVALKSVDACPGGLRATSVMAQRLGTGPWESQLSECLHHFNHAVLDDNLLLWAQFVQVPVLGVIYAVTAGLVAVGVYGARRAGLPKPQCQTPILLGGFFLALLFLQATQAHTILEVTRLFR